MSSLNTTNLNANLKAQQLTGKKALQDSAQAVGNTGFENLFANALSQRSNPQAKLSQINEELQEALGSNSNRNADGNKKAFKANENNNPDANTYGMAGSTLAQANMWAQRDWALSNKAEPAVTSSSTASANASSASKTTSSTASNTNAQAKTEGASAEKAVDKPKADTSNSGATTQAKDSSNDASNNAASQASTSGTGSSAQAQNTNDAAAANAADPTQAAASGSNADATVVAGQAAATPADAGTPTANLELSTTALATDATAAQAGTSSPTGMDSNPNASVSQVADTSAGVAATAPEGRNDLQATDTNARTGAELKADNTTGNRSEAPKTVFEPAAANNPATQATRPEVAQAAVAMQAAQAGGKGRSLKAGDEILATSASGGASVGTGSTASNQAAGIGLAAMATGRTGSAAEATIKTPVNQPGFVKELGAQVQWAVGKNLSTVDIRLTAGQLGGDAGNMNMRIIQRGQDIQLVIRTQDEATANMLNQTVAGLKETLAQSGLQLSQVQIQSGNGQNQATSSNPFNAQQQAQQQAGQSGQNPGGQSGRQGNPQGNLGQDGPAASSEPVRRNRSNGNIDLVA